MIEKLNPYRLSTNKPIVTIFYMIIVSFFLLFVFFPVTSIFFSGGLKLGINGEMLDALKVSFEIASLALIIDIVFGLPIAWILARHDFKLKPLLNSMIDMPLILPTSALGFSVVLFWGAGGLNFFTKGFWPLVLIHIAMTYPYIVRIISAAIEEVDISYEVAGKTLGASPLTVFRTITSPLFKEGLIVGAILALTRSLGETGASAIAIDLSTALRTVPTKILDYKNLGMMGDATSLAILLTSVSVVLLLLVKVFMKSFKVPLGVYNAKEKVLSRFVLPKNTAAFSFFFLIILLPSFFFFRFLLDLHTVDYTAILGSVFLSFFISAVVTVINLAFSIPLAYIIAKNKFNLGFLLDLLNEVVLVMPTVAIGLSIGLFWNGLNLNELLVVILANLSFSFPYIVKPVAAAMKGVDPLLEEAARGLGAKPFKVFKTITFSLIRPSIIAGATIAFMRSISDTGAVMAVSKTLKPVSVLIVKLSKSNAYPEAAMASLVLFIIAFLIIIVTRKK